MSTTISLHVPHSRTAPRFAAPLGEFFAAAIALLVHPGTPAPRYPTRDVARVRAMAHQFEGADPRFASELYAAADRHEILNGL